MKVLVTATATVITRIHFIMCIFTIFMYAWILLEICPHFYNFFANIWPYLKPTKLVAAEHMTSMPSTDQ